MITHLHGRWSAQRRFAAGALSYPFGKDGKQSYDKIGPVPTTFSGKRALDFVIKNNGNIDKSLLFDIELLEVRPVPPFRARAPEAPVGMHAATWLKAHRPCEQLGSCIPAPSPSH